MSISTRNPIRSLYVVTVMALAVPVIGLPARALAADDVIVIKSAQLHTGTGEVIANAIIVIKDGVIRAVGQDIAIPSGAVVIEVPGAGVTPGLIDANAMLEPTDVWTPVGGTTRSILHDFFCPRHKDGPVLGCCGSTCPRALAHVDGNSCDLCGFPNRRPDAALADAALADAALADAALADAALADAALPGAALGTRRGMSLAEQSSEVIPHTRVIDSVNLRSPDLDRLLAGGVTTVFVSPDPAAVISSQGAIIRTGGPVAKRIVRETHAIKAVMGSDPYSRGRRNHLPFRSFVDFHARRPTTRMGVTWIFRKALYDAKRHAAGLDVHGADTPSEPALVALFQMLSGEIPLRIQARLQQDILAAIRLADEFALPFVLEEATEAHLCIDEIKAKQIPVVYGPIYISTPGQRAFSETRAARLHTLAALLEGGIETALTANDLRDEDGLARQAMYAMRYGVTRAQVTRCVTTTPAKLLGIDDRVGSIQPGKRADIVVWSGAPFEASSRPIVVLIEGNIVLDRRKG